MISRCDIENNKIIVIKDFPSNAERVDFWHHANTCDYSYSQKSDVYIGQKQTRLAHHFDPLQFEQTTFFERIKHNIDKPIRLMQAYINYAESSTLNFPHCDSYHGHVLSILLCINQDWHRNWGGYTSFFKDISSNDIIETVVPEPGKAIFFNGRLFHTATPPNITSQVPRFMLAIKIEWLENEIETEKEEI